MDQFEAPRLVNVTVEEAITLITANDLSSVETLETLLKAQLEAKRSNRPDGCTNEEIEDMDVIDEGHQSAIRDLFLNQQSANTERLIEVFERDGMLRDSIDENFNQSFRILRLLVPERFHNLLVLKMDTYEAPRIENGSNYATFL
jgi:hypothetical protein